MPDLESHATYFADFLHVIHKNFAALFHEFGHPTKKWKQFNPGFSPGNKDKLIFHKRKFNGKASATSSNSENVFLGQQILLEKNYLQVTSALERLNSEVLRQDKTCFL